MTRGTARLGTQGHRETCTAESKPSDASKYLTLPCSPRCHRCTGRGPSGSGSCPQHSAGSPTRGGC